MKNKLWTLFKYTTLNNLKIGKNIKVKMVPQNIVKVVITVLLLAIVLAYSSLYAYIGYQALNAYGLKEYLQVIFYIIASLSIFMFSIYKAKGILFESKDNDMIFSMPIKFSTVLSSRVLTLLSTNYLLATVIFLPCIVMYSIFTSVGLLYFVNSLVVFAFLPIVPTVLASIVGYIVAYVSSKSGNKKWFEIIFTFAIFFGITILSSNMNTLIMKLVGNIDKFNDLFKKYGYIVYYVKDAIINGNMISLLLYIALNVVIFALFAFILARQYKLIISRLSTTKTKSKGKGKIEYTRGTKKSALFKKEFKRYISSPIYVFNTAFGVIALLLLTIYAIFIDSSILNNMIQSEGIDAPMTMYQVVIFITVFIVGLSCSTCSSISLEGKNLWIIKSLPVSINDIFTSKLLINILLVLPITIVCLLALSISLKFTLIQIAINIILVIFLNLFVSIFGLLINLKYPKLEFTSDSQAVKQSMSSFIGVMVPMCIAMVIFFIYGFVASKYLSIEAYSMLIAIVLALLCFLENYILKTYGVKRFKEI